MSLATRQQLKVYLKRLGIGEETPSLATHGLCYAIEYSLDRELFSELKRLMKQWPEYSGNPAYPVPHPRFPPKAAYYGTHNLWGDSSYGQARRRLCLWLSEQL